MNVLTAKETMTLFLEIVRYGRKKKKYQTKTYSKYQLSRSKKDGRDDKIHRSDKKYPNNLQTKLSCEKRNHKTRGGYPVCKRNESDDPGDKNRHRSSH